MKILCVHPNNELYGSDRSFLQALAAVREADPAGSLEVRLVSEGPISPHVAKVSTRVLYGPMWVLRKAKIKQIVAGAPVTFPLAVLRARQQIKASGCDLLYINTLVPIDYLFAARMMKKGKAICHVREIPTGAAMKVFSWILKISGCRVVYNSEATRDAFDFKGTVDETVIYNGVPSPENVEAPQPQDRLKVLLIGRFNSWKGQTVLVRALASLPPEQRARIDVRLVGGVYSDQNHFIDTVKAEIEKAGLQERVTLHPFIADPSEHFRWADVFAVPSTLPEPFGRVAIEGMSFKRPVIATNHGGLAEIVEHGRTGILVEPGSETSLAAALSELLADPSKVQAMGEAGYARFNTLFSEEVYQKNMLGLFGLSRDAR